MSHADDLPFRSRRANVLASNGMVATSQPLAAQAGLDMLKAGGNAADAAIATAAALAVTEPTSTGLGGDCFALYYDASTREVSAVNGSGRAPAGLSLELLAERGITAESGIGGPSSVHTVTVPGTAAGWRDTLDRHGTMTLAEVLQPAIALAERGFPVSPLIADYWVEQMPRVLQQPNSQELTIEGRGPRPGEIWRNPGLAGVLRAIAEGGVEAFYEGDPARAIVAVCEQLGGTMTLNDLTAHHSTFEPPISTSYRGYTVYECPPNGQGLAPLIALSILDGFDLASLDPLSPERLHLLIEAMRLGFADARWFVCDPAFGDPPVERLLSPEYTAERRALIDPARANPAFEHGVPELDGGTVYLSAVDGQGNACSFINSNYVGFGTGIVPKGYGFSLQNRGLGFSLDPEHPSALAPGKRPYHTIIPCMTVRPDGSLHASFGVKGGFAQPPGHVQVLSNMLDHGMDPQSALDTPRFVIQGGVAAGAVAIETGVPVETMDALARLGHDIVPSTDRFAFGTGHIIVRDAETGVLWGAAEPRADGAAVGF